MKYFLLNDRDEYNQRYRGALIAGLNDTKCTFSSAGFLDSPWAFVKVLSKLCDRNIVISSNLRSNVLFMLFFAKRGMVILNGLGRYKRNYFVRNFVGFLISINRKKIICIQNYLDYRYFSRYHAAVNLVWVPGSGGSKRAAAIRDTSSVLVISRDSKILSVTDSIRDFIKLRPDYQLKLIGCSDRLFDLSGLASLGVLSFGYTEQDQLFIEGGIFFQPTGYGEGIPHSLVDAMISDLCIYMSKKLYIEYGFYKFGWKYTEIGKSLIYLAAFENDYSPVSDYFIKRRYINILRLKSLSTENINKNGT